MKLGRAGALAGVSLLAFCASPALAEGEAGLEAGTAAEAEAATNDPQSAQEIVVQAEIGYRNRSETAEPVLVYDTDYFQRFEPLTIGDALKRVPSVTFLSDVIESDGARLRGLDPGYTQILINGEKIPGSNVDRSFFLDRIPAELVDRVEIVRSNSARRTADAVAGTLNIVLRDALALDGGYVRVGGLLFDDGEVKPNVGAVYGGAVGPGRLLIGGNIQGRYNPKKKSSLRFGDSPENNPNYATEEFDNREDQTDTRDGTDYNANASYAMEFGPTKVELNGFYVHTDRTETERSFEYNEPTGVFGPVPDGEGEVPGLLTDNSNIADIDQDSWSASLRVGHTWSVGETRFRSTFASFLEDRDETEFEIDFDDDDIAFEGARTLSDIKDREFSLALDHKVSLGTGVAFQFGAFLQNKNRKTDIREGEQEFDLDESFRGWDQFDSFPDDLAGPFEEFEIVTGGLNKIKEHRRDLFALVEGENGPISWEAGVRYEHTSVDIRDLDESARFDNDYGLFLPSASIKADLTGRDRITASVARTNRRPRFDFISPALLEGELGENDLLGNPDLKPETAWGVDVGYERRIGRTGVAGVNLFYRKVHDLVEIANTGVEGSEGEGTFVLQPRNTGDGKAWGIEFDLSASLGFVGLRDTGVFGNLALLDSSVRDFAGKRRFNGQSKYVFNVGFIQNLRTWDAAFGATYRKQGSAKDRIVGEEVRTTYGADLEVFIEKRLFNKLTVRAVGSNLLDGKKKEVFNKFDTIEDQLDRDFDEYELESEKAGPVFQLVARYAF
ncbi:TonB-dependent receptor plug domain-containing protein [Sphingomonas arenae]|uniref:TonB-dependent receptor plug domain-containing protein n=1 Tax=Sphingomonas arenae TaxID=2812555 RepID=UPI001967F870|nr:TonB-dependent receptor [Sphingomonas arenae]